MADTKRKTTKGKARKAKPRTPRVTAAVQKQPEAAAKESAQPIAAVAAEPAVVVRESAEPAVVVEVTAPETTAAATQPKQLLPRSVDGPLLTHLMRENPFRAKVISLLVKKLTG